MTKTALFKTARVILILAAALVIVTPVLAQGTVPGGGGGGGDGGGGAGGGGGGAGGICGGGGGQSTSGNTGNGVLNSCTGTVRFDPGECAGSCTVTPDLDSAALNSQNGRPFGWILSAGFRLQVTPITFGVPYFTIGFQAPSSCMPINVGANFLVTNCVIMQFDTSLVPPRWVAMPTFFNPVTGELYTNARLQGNFALFTQSGGGTGGGAGGGQSTSGNTGSGVLNAGIGTVRFDAGECAGTCTVTPDLDPAALITLNGRPAGGILLAGFRLQVTPITFGVPFLTIGFQTPSSCIPINIGANFLVTNCVIMQFDTSLVPPRWVAMPTFSNPITGELYTNARLLGNFALFTQP